MAAFLPILKTTLPYVIDVLKIAIPAFTSKTDDKKDVEIIPAQILELQSAAAQNAESVKVIATQLKNTIEGIETASIKIEKELISFKRISMISIVIAMASFGFSVFIALNK